MGYLIAAGILVLPALVALSAMWRGYVLSILWLWFVVPLFGLPPLGVVTAIGLCLVVGMFSSTTHCDDNRSAIEKVITPILQAAIAPALALFIGSIVRGFL